MPLYRDPIAELRRLAQGDLSDEPAPAPLTRFDEETLRREAELRAYERSSQSERALRQGGSNVRASFKSAKGLARVLTGNEEGGLEDLREAQRIQAEAAEFGPRVQSVEDVDGIGSGLEYARNLGLQQLPNIALAAGTGLAGGALRVGAGTLARGAAEKALARGVASSLAERTGQAAVKKAAVDTARRRIARKLPARALAREFEQGGALGGAAAGSVLQSSMAPGIVLDDDPNNTASVQERARAAAAGAVATGALEALPVAALFRRYGLTGAQEAVQGSIVSRLAQQGARQGTAEALTEVAQTAGERAAHAYINDNIDVIGPEAYSDYINAAAGGFVGGSLFGAPAGLRGAKSDSPAGKRYAESFRDYMGRFKRSPKPDDGAGPPAGIPPGTRIDEGEPVNVPEFARKAAETLKTVADTVKGKVPDLANKGRDILGQVQARAKDFLDQTDTNNSITELLDAEPFGGVDSDIGTRTFTRGADPITGVARAGIGPAMDLIPDGVRPGRIAAEFDVPLKTAIVGSMIEDPALRASLFDSGAMDEAAKVLEGADPSTLDNDKLTAFQDALGPEGSPRRNAFARVGATFWQMKKDDREAALPPRGATRTETTRNQKAAGIVDVEAPLRDTKKVVREWKRDAGKPLAKSAPAPENSLVLTNKKGERFALPGNQIGAMLQHAREQDPTYGEGGTALKVAKLLGDFIENGYKLDQSSLKPIRLADGWHLTEQGVRQLTSPGATLVEDASKNPPGLSGDKRQAALTREYGKKDRPGKGLADEGGEMASMMGEPLGPRQGRPLGDRVVTDEKSDRRVVRARKAMAATDKARDRLDNVLKGLYGPDVVIENEDQRRDLFMQAWKKYGGIKADNLQSSAGARDTRDLLSNRLRDAAAAYKEAKDVERRALRPKQGEQTKARAPEETRTRLLPGQTLDSSKPSPKQARIEREANEVPELDDILAERFGAKPESFEQRREQYAALRAELTAQAKGANQRVPRQALARLNEAAEAFGERTRVQAVNRLNKARKAYLAEWNKLSQPEKVELADDLGLKDVNPVALANKVKFIKKDARQPFYDRVAAAAPDGSRLMSTLEEFTNASGAYYASGLTERATKSENVARAREANPQLAKVAPVKPPVKKTGRSDVRSGKFTVAQRLRKAVLGILHSPAEKKAYEESVAELKELIAADPNTTDYVEFARLFANEEQVPPNPLADTMLRNLLKTAQGRARVVDQLRASRSRVGVARMISGIARVAKNDTPLLISALSRLVALNESLGVASQFPQPGRSKAEGTYLRAWTHFNAAGVREGTLAEAFASLLQDRIAGGIMSDRQRAAIELFSKSPAAEKVRFSHEDIHDAGPHYDPNDNEVVVPRFADMDAEMRRRITHLHPLDVYIHEAAHALTVLGEAADPKIRADLGKLLNHIRKHADSAGLDVSMMYGLQNTQELLAEAFSNPEFQEILRKMPALNTKSFANLWEEFKSIVARLLGMSDATALEEVLTLGLGLERATVRLQKAASAVSKGAADRPVHGILGILGSDINHSPTENPLFEEFDRLRAAAAVRYKAISARREAMEQEEEAKLRAKYGTRFDEEGGRWQLRDMAYQNLSEDSDEYFSLGREMHDYPGAPDGPIKDFYEFRRANEDALRRHPTIRRLYDRGLQRRLDANKSTLPTIERMAIEFELAALRGGFTEAWRADQLAQKLRRVEKYKAEDNYKSNPRLQAVVAQIEKEIELIRAGDAQAVIGMNAREYSDTIVPILPNESDVSHSPTADAEGVSAAIDEQVKNRSRRGLIALANKIANSTLGETIKSKLQAKIEQALHTLQAATSAAGTQQFLRTGVRSKTAAHFNSFKKAVSGHDKLDAALKAVREIATPDQKRLIDTLLGMASLRGVKLQVVSRDGEGVVSGVHNAPNMTAKSIESTVTLRLSGTAEGPSVDGVYVLLHEAIHAATTWAEQNSPASRRAVAQMLAHAREQALKLGVDPDVFYGLSETQEFLAESFTNPDLQNLLRQMPARNTDKFASLWDEFKDFVRQLLGLSAKDATLLDEVFTVGLDMARETAAKRESIYAEVFGLGASDSSYSPTAIINTPSSGSQATDYIPLLSPDNRRFLEGAFRRGDVYRQIEAALPPNRRDELASADRGPQLLINAGIALALQGKLSLKNDTKTFMGAANELWDIISRVLQLPSKTVYARKVLADIASQGAVRGAKSDVRAATLHPAALAVTRKVNATLVPVVQSFARDMDQRMRKTGVPALTQLATLISQRTGENRADRTGSYSARKLVERNRRMNAYFKIVGKWSDEHKAAVIKALHTQTPGGHVTIKGALQDISGDVAAVRAFYADMRDYLVAAGVLGPDQALDNYFPVSVGPENVVKHKQDFIDLFSAPNIAKGARARDLQMLKKQRKKAADNGASEKHLAWFDKRREQIKAMTDAELAESWYAFASAAPGEVRVAGVTFADGEHVPGFKYENQRLMDFVYKLGTPDQIETFAKFQDQNIDRVTVRYIDRATRRGEWERMDLTDRIAALMTEAAKQGATPEQLQMAQDFVDQVMGSYGSDWHPWIKKITDNFGINLPPFEKFKALQSSLITYQNLRLLPLALMSSLIDPLGVSVREGATPRIFSAYRDALRALRDKNGSDALRAMAEDMGIIERHAVSEALIYMYGGASDPSGVNARLNAALFKYNGLEYVTKFSRLAALAAGQRFLIAHKDGSNVDSKRYLRELNLTPADVQVDAAGNLVRSAKIDAALTRFVDESVVRPTPTQRPGWHNDPHFALAAQYKGYLYSFWNTISRRIGVELANANFSVLLPVMMYLPVTMLGEMTRDLAQGDDDDRDALAYAKLSVERSGLLGPHVAALMDAGQDRSYGNSVLNSVSGPTGQQLGQAYDAANGRRGAGKTFVEALPASALFEDWFP